MRREASNSLSTLSLLKLASLRYTAACCNVRTTIGRYVNKIRELKGGALWIYVFHPRYWSIPKENPIPLFPLLGPAPRIQAKICEESFSKSLGFYNLSAAPVVRVGTGNKISRPFPSN